MQVSSINVQWLYLGSTDLEARLVEYHTGSHLFFKSLIISCSVYSADSSRDVFSSRSLYTGVSDACKSNSAQWRYHYGLPQGR